MPVQNRHILRAAGLGMPAEQVIVMLANFARPVMVADVVVIRLRQGHVHKAEDQQRDPQPATAPMPGHPPSEHDNPYAQSFRNKSVPS
jgi:hypothetical protein